MLETLQTLPQDPVLGLAGEARADTNPDKVDLTLGVYMDEDGLCPVFDAVRRAQDELVAQEQTKVYMPPAGDADFNAGMRDLLLGAGHSALADARVSSIQTPGGCGALRIGAEVLRAASPQARVWVSDPTWPVHIPLLGSVGLEFASYRYYRPDTHSVDFDAMMEDLAQARRGDVVLLHGCCHNPCGADLSPAQWEAVATLAERQGFTPFIDIAYQGLGDGLDADAAGLRLLAERLPEVIVAASSSKNMGLYRERTGITLFVSQAPEHAANALGHGLAAARRCYSMPPAHGAIIAGRILANAELGALWRAELAGMCGRINGLRATLRAQLEAATDRDFGFVEREKGMFSFLGLSPEQTLRLRREHSVYMLDSSRINVAGVNASNVEYLAKAVAAVL
ncbi:aspartate/tyrosine/aromatic aminotransferase [Mangrovimicrobium sediminis]|uniref:Aspartate/tyrosine/aromatic aminotransferase n=1 Tax=Mangrovimicrobium sediminis TaxID=2562682 RepID=A0A4Z0M346_9GAMM|nr:amino acid aminotransferase [Haliea sp. SAOS-164]TGD73867.1 aspartate/tyrosine/aromatic aminotransferase [Haliea sp. SAOS-164]